ncbi:hypothetical protein CFIMG_002740RA [Ceratocystis fimbriata CBS 114723]|uniref:Uncharacterized protein n=1 Tax=Ceratocystis fimbriata CBS 114723 TaxID=1035309 RepID=A0A2C5X216_9PEZI|nr:hypothetical protein CFIMG_002740RA [Ceratocystis fimbriata CBS 114723]
MRLLASLNLAGGLVQGSSLSPSRDHAATTNLASHSHAEANAFGIFNTVLAGMRQWDSSVHHNGMAFVPAQVPEGTLLYHGGISAEVPDTLEWLAFEIEHAQNFARSFRGDWKPRFPPPGTKPGKKPPAGPGVGPIKPPHSGAPKGGHRPDDTTGHRGYLHTYRATRPLKMLYLDGMAAAKAMFGPLDQQDLILATKPIEPGYSSEFERATQICDLFSPIGVDGIIRMEAGFEIIHCNFSSGLEQLSATRQPYPDTEPWFGPVSTFQWLRAVARRYDGIGAHRVQLSWSGAVAGWWYPFNTSSLDPAFASLPRFEQASPKMRAAIRADVVQAMSQDWPPAASVDWQGVVDMVAGRFSRRLEALAAADADPQLFVTQVMETAAPYFNTPLQDDEKKGQAENELSKSSPEETAVDRCVDSFFYPVVPLIPKFTTADNLIYVALTNVTREICTAMFDARSILLTAAPKTAAHLDQRPPPGGRPEDEKPPLNHVLIPAVPKAQPIIQALVKKLDWAEWKRCYGCKYNEECFIAMFPFGTPEDHFRPQCFNDTAMHEHAMLSMGNSYWRTGMKDRQETHLDVSEEMEENPEHEQQVMMMGDL